MSFAQVSREKALSSEHGKAIPPDSQQEIETSGQAASEEVYLSTVEEESGDKSMLLSTSSGGEDDLDVSQDNGIWERRRSATFNNTKGW